MSENPLLAKLRLPGRIFQLPSRGLLYTNGEISAEIENAEIHVRALTAFDEITIKNPDMLFSGKALAEVLKNVTPDILKPDELYGKDVDAIMIFLRIVTYGPEYILDINHGCENGISHSYSVNLEELVQRTTFLDPTLFETKYKIVLPSGQEVRLQPVKYKHIIELLRNNEKKSKLTAEDLQENLMMSMLSIIKSVDGVNNRKFIEEWLRVLPAGDVGLIAKQVNNTTEWGPDLIVKNICKDCGAEIEVEIPINPISFF
jgi:hypothetical protein